MRDKIYLNKNIIWLFFNKVYKGFCFFYRYNVEIMNVMRKNMVFIILKRYLKEWVNYNYNLNCLL